MVRVLVVPPDVNEPGGQGAHSDAASPLKRLSAPHGAHDDALKPECVPVVHAEHIGAPSAAYVPGSQRVVVFEPSHAQPAGHTVHVPWLFGNEPGEQALQTHASGEVAPRPFCVEKNAKTLSKIKYNRTLTTKSKRREKTTF